MTKNLSYGTRGRYACLLYDSTLKAVLGTSANEDLFIEIIELLIPGKHISHLQMLNKEYHGLADSEKSVNFDLLCTDADTGEEFLVEMQNAPQDSFTDRVLYYSYFPIREQLERKRRESMESPVPKMDYSLRPVYVISLLNFELKHECPEALEDSYISRYEIRNGRCGELLTDSVNYVFVEMGRLTLNEDEWEKCRTRLERFVFAMKYMHTFAEFPAGLMADSMLEKLSRAAELANLGTIELRQYEKAMYTELDRQGQLSYAKREGWEEGHAEGKAEGKAELVKAKQNSARAMLADGLDVSKVVKYTGLSVEEVEALRN